MLTRTEVPEALARSVAAAVEQLRGLDLVKPPGVAEAIDWARALTVLGADAVDGDAGAGHWAGP